VGEEGAALGEDVAVDAHSDRDAFFSVEHHRQVSGRPNPTQTLALVLVLLVVRHGGHRVVGDGQRGLDRGGSERRGRGREKGARSMAKRFRARKPTRATPEFGKRPDLANTYNKLLEIVLLRFLLNF
jgi:hypothetical protein